MKIGVPPFVEITTILSQTRYSRIGGEHPLFKHETPEEKTCYEKWSDLVMSWPAVIRRQRVINDNSLQIA